jgi:hypothetical protein
MIAPRPRPVLSVVAMQDMLRKGITAYKDKQSKVKQVQLGKKVLECIQNLFHRVSLRRQQRNDLAYFLDGVLNALEEQQTDAKDSNFEERPQPKKARHGAGSQQQRKAMLRAVDKAITLLAEANVVLDTDPQHAIRLSLKLADVGAMICCKPEFNELKQFIQKELLPFDELPRGPPAVQDEDLQ